MWFEIKLWVENHVGNYRLYENLQEKIISQEEYFLFKKNYAAKIKKAEKAIKLLEEEKEQALDRNRERLECYTDKIREAQVNAVVLDAIRILFDCTDKLQKRVDEMKTENSLAALDIMKCLEKIQRELSACEDQRMESIELLNTGGVAKEEYLSRRNALNTREKDLKQRLLELQQEKHNAETADAPEVKGFLDAVGKYSGQTELTNAMAKAFIDRVLIYEPGKVEIRWKFSDGLMKMLME